MLHNFKTFKNEPETKTFVLMTFKTGTCGIEKVLGIKFRLFVV